MKLNESLVAEPIVKNVDLVKGRFTKSETADIVNSLINEKINFHKIQRLQLWESDHSCNSDELNTRLQELESLKVSTKEWIGGQRSNGCNFKIEGTLRITVED